MQKTIQITVAPDRTDGIVELLRDQEGLLGLQVQRAVSVHPPGDIVTGVLSTPAMARVLRELQDRRIGADGSSSISTADLSSVISPAVRESMGTDPSGLGWEAIETEIAKESNMTMHALLLMGIAGAIAAAGIATSTLHLVVGAMIIAPGFEPITRISLGIVTRGEGWRHGLVHVAKGYTALIAGAVAGSLVLVALGTWPGGESTYLAPGELVSYWITITPVGVLVTALAASAGALLVASDRSVLTAGVLVSLALIPSAALVGMALVAWDLPVLGRAALRWLIDVALVGLMAVPVFVWHGSRLGRRRSML